LAARKPTGRATTLIIPKRIPELPLVSLARLKAAEADAEHQLTREVTEFFQRCKTPGFAERHLKRIPWEIDLVDFFCSYADKVFCAAAREHLLQSQNPKSHIEILKILVSDTQSKITARDGVWRRVVETSGMRVDMGSWSSKYRWYGVEDFTMPQRTPLAGALRLALKRSEQAAWEFFASKAGTVGPVNGEDVVSVIQDEPAKAISLDMAVLPPTTSSPMPSESANSKTTLGRNIDRLRKECGWSFDQLSAASSINKKTILGHVNKGRRPHPDTLATYASTFGEKLGRVVTVAELESAPR